MTMIKAQGLNFQKNFYDLDLLVECLSQWIQPCQAQWLIQLSSTQALLSLPPHPGPSIFLPRRVTSNPVLRKVSHETTPQDLKGEESRPLQHYLHFSEDKGHYPGR